MILDDVSTDRVSESPTIDIMPFTVLTDPGRIIGGYYRLSGVPETLLIDKNGKLIYKFIGPKDWTGEELLKIFNDLIKKTYKEIKK